MALLASPVRLLRERAGNDGTHGRPPYLRTAQAGPIILAPRRTMSSANCSDERMSGFESPAYHKSHFYAKS
jgi:hypothetical protein